MCVYLNIAYALCRAHTLYSQAQNRIHNHMNMWVYHTYVLLQLVFEI